MDYGRWIYEPQSEQRYDYKILQTGSRVKRVFEGKVVYERITNEIKSVYGEMGSSER